MDCPNGHGQLEKALFHEVEVDYCPTCLGMFFEQDELPLAKNDADKQLNWLDFDVWREKGRFEVSAINNRCPNCRMMMVRVGYDSSQVKIDFCKNCQGVWLDRGEFKQLMVYLKKKADYEVLHNYTKNLTKQLWEVFTGPEKFRDELDDCLMLLKLLNYKFVTQHPVVHALIETSGK